MAGIDRDYWLDFAKEEISKSIDNREKAADKLDTFLTWIWSIYTSVFVLASLFNFLSSDICQLIWVAQPIFIIMLSRYFCTIVSMPSENNDDKIRADPNDVASIIDSFRLIVENKKRKLKVAKIFTLVSILSITTALIGYNFYDPNKDIKQDLQKAKLKKELNSQEIIRVKAQQSINDSIKLINDYYDSQIQNLIKKRKLNYVENHAIKIDSLKLFEK